MDNKYYDLLKSEGFSAAEIWEYASGLIDIIEVWESLEGIPENKWLDIYNGLSKK